MSELEKERELTRRTFVASLFAAAAVPVRWESILRASRADVTIAQFSDAGVRTGTATVPKVVKPEAEWRTQLGNELVFEVTRHGDTERPFTGAFWNLHEKGYFRCVCCDTALFSSAHKFDSGTGWPSFWRSIAAENVAEHVHGAMDTDLKCKRCDAHLGDLFDDGPKPTGLRYCIDSAALKFVKTA